MDVQGSDALGQVTARDIANHPRLVPFAEKPIVDQIEILRQELLYFREERRWLQRALQDLSFQVQSLHQHEHVDGRVLVPASSGNCATGVGLTRGSSYDPLA